MKNRKTEKWNPFSWINGVKGAISLFMAVLMTPFLSVALILVEVGRYNSAVSLLDEMLGLTSMSVLADHDDYLQERWGLLAVSQEADINADYATYLTTNSQVMGSALTVTKSTAAGSYALSDHDVLEMQLMEYSKLNIPTALVKEITSKLFSLTELAEKLKGLKNLENISKLLTKGVSTLDSGITMVESAEALKKSAEELDKLKKDYDTNYTAFEKAVNTLIENLKTKKSIENEKKPYDEEKSTLVAERKVFEDEMEELKKKNQLTSSKKKSLQEKIDEKNKEIEEVDKDLKPYEDQLKSLNKTISKNKTAAATAKTNYATTINSIITELTNFKDNMAKNNEAVVQITKNVAGAVSDAANIVTTLEKKRTDLAEQKKDLEALKKSVEEWDGQPDDPSYIAGSNMLAAQEEKVSALQKEIGELETISSVASATSSGVGEMTSEWKESSSEYSEATIGEVITGFQKLYSKVNGYDTSAITRNSAKITKTVYKTTSVKGYIAADQIQAYLDAQEKKLKEGSLKAVLDGLMTIYNSLMRFSVFYESKLNSVIDMNYYSETFGGLPGGASADNPVLNIMKEIASICRSGTDFISDLADLDLLGMLKNLKSIANSALEIFKQAGTIIKNFLTNIVQLFTSYEKWYTAAYCSYNLACRTDFGANSSTSISTLTGYGVGKDSFDEALNYPETYIFGDIAALVDTIVRLVKNTGEDIMFTGAELEYMIFGSSSEIVNQLYVFLVMYLIRMLSSLPAIMADAEVQSLAASATLGYPVVIALYVLLEPFVQTVLLVNGKGQPLIPTEVYLSPSGLPKLVNELVWFCHLSFTEAQNMSNKMIDAVAETRDDYDFNKQMYEHQSTGQSIKLSIDFDYKDYCLVILLLTTTQEQQIGRLANLIQMETLCYYQNQGKDFTFDLRKAYTYIQAEVEADINQIMPSLIDSSLFSVERENYRGY